MQDGSFFFNCKLVILQIFQVWEGRDGGKGRYVDVFEGAGFHEVVVAVCAAVGEQGVACCLYQFCHVCIFSLNMDCVGEK